MVKGSWGREKAEKGEAEEEQAGEGHLWLSRAAPPPPAAQGRPHRGACAAGCSECFNPYALSNRCKKNTNGKNVLHEIPITENTGTNAKTESYSGFQKNIGYCVRWAPIISKGHHYLHSQVLQMEAIRSRR